MSSPEHEVGYFIPFYEELLAAGIDFVIIGGQACNIWSLLYESSESDLQHYRPYSSSDVDLYSRSQSDISKAAQHLKVEPVLGEPGSTAPVMGYLVIETDEAPILIQFLTGAAGIARADEIFESRQTVQLASGLQLQVMHPIHALQSKLAMAGKRGDKIQQDLKHLNMALLFVRAFIFQTASSNERHAITLCKRIIRQAKSMEGIRIFKRFSIEVETAVPDKMDCEAFPKFCRFLRDTYPSLLQEVSYKRSKSHGR